MTLALTICTQLAIKWIKLRKHSANDFRMIENWFYENVMVLNAEKILLNAFWKWQSKWWLCINGLKLPNSCQEQVIMSLNLNHILEGQKRIPSSLDPEKEKLVANTVIRSHFSYCLVIWSFSFRKFNKLINRIHKKPLTTVYDNMMTRGTEADLGLLQHPRWSALW